MGTGKYFFKANGLIGLLSLHEATEYMYSRLDENYIPRERLIELATRFKDCANGDEDMENVIDDMEDYELDFFGIEREE